MKSLHFKNQFMMVQFSLQVPSLVFFPFSGLYDESYEYLPKCERKYLIALLIFLIIFLFKQHGSFYIFEYIKIFKKIFYMSLDYDFLKSVYILPTNLDGIIYIIAFDYCVLL